MCGFIVALSDSSDFEPATSEAPQRLDRLGPDRPRSGRKRRPISVIAAWPSSISISIRVPRS